MPKFLSVLTVAVALGACAALVIAQEATPPHPLLAASAPAGERSTDENKPEETSGSEKPAEKPVSKTGATPAPLPSTEPTPTPKPRRRSFFSWLFGSHRHKEEATATPASTPSPTSTAHKSSHRTSGTPAPETSGVYPPEETTAPKHGRVTPTPRPIPTPKKTERPIHGSKPGTTPKPENSTPAAKTEKVTPGPVATPPPRKTPKPKATPAASANGNNAPAEETDPEAREKARFEVAKAKAVEDPQIKGLKDKADQASTDEESRAALRAYNKALFEKIKKIDGGVSNYADPLEKAVLKRLSE